MSRGTRKTRIIRKSAAQIPAPTAADLDRLRKVMDGPIDTSDIPELTPGFKRVRRDSEGRPPRYHRGPVCEAILKELGRRDMTRYELWQRAREHCPTLPESAVYEYLRGQRQIGVIYLEALLAALDLTLRPRRTARAK